MKIFAVTSPGLEVFAADELRRLGLLSTAAGRRQTSVTDAGGNAAQNEELGGVLFEGDLAALYNANLHLHTTSRLLVRLAEFRATTFAALRKRAGDLKWETFLSSGQPIALHVTCRKSRLYHSDAVAERIAGAINDRMGQPAPVRKPANEEPDSTTQLVIVRLTNDICSISIDSSGELLHRRGYRLASAKAPLRETLAAGLILASGWDASSPLLDPFCGSGTIPIEAARMAAKIPPGKDRKFAFMNWPGFDAHAWDKVLGSVATLPLQAIPLIQASDRDSGAIQMAQANAERAGVGAAIDFTHRALSSVEPPNSAGWLVTNPPYGLRVSARQDLRNLYAQLGNVVRARCPGWRVAILCNDLQLMGQTRLGLDTSLRFVNGGVSVRVGRGVVPAK